MQQEVAAVCRTLTSTSTPPPLHAIDQKELVPVACVRPVVSCCGHVCGCCEVHLRASQPLISARGLWNHHLGQSLSLLTKGQSLILSARPPLVTCRPPSFLFSWLAVADPSISSHLAADKKDCSPQFFLVDFESSSIDVCEWIAFQVNSQRQ